MPATLGNTSRMQVDEAEASLQSDSVETRLRRSSQQSGNTLQELGRLDEAEAAGKAIALKPDMPKPTTT